ncbi:hypothetical protein A3K63_02035 [Candidatus Micrarchaeota archaeon RBG_16_49_10]|nr:MAG: hypothetical protein A3K63_02035 [Candidatus Micrarchaeota archaeon RBG_16_49_10]
MIYLDTNIIVYAIENHPTYGKKCKRILENIQKNKTNAGCSTLVLVELINVLKKINRELEKKGTKALDIKKNIDAVLSLPITWFDMGLIVIKRASEYDYKISGIDYIHVATMELNSISEVMSADKELDRVPILTRLDPLKT